MAMMTAVSQMYDSIAFVSTNRTATPPEYMTHPDSDTAYATAVVTAIVFTAPQAGTKLHMQHGTDGVRPWLIVHGMLSRAWTNCDPWE